jgi:hypothetical protein
MSNLRDKLEAIILLIVLVAFLGAFFNIPSLLTGAVTQWLISLFIGTIFTFVAGALVTTVIGDTLDDFSIFFYIRIYHIYDNRYCNCHIYRENIAFRALTYLDF